MQIKSIVLSIAALAVVNAAPTPAPVADTTPATWNNCMSIAYDANQAWNYVEGTKDGAQRKAMEENCKVCIQYKDDEFVKCAKGKNMNA